jgi:hypothetical protein
MKIRLDQTDGLDTGTAIEIEACNPLPARAVSVRLWNGEEHAAIELNAERAQQVAMALIAAFRAGGDAG